MQCRLPKLESCVKDEVAYVNVDLELVGYSRDTTVVYYSVSGYSVSRLGQAVMR